MILNLKRNFYGIFAFLIAFVCLTGFTACSSSGYDQATTTQVVNSDETATNLASSNTSGILTVNYIDVGQADSILIQSPSGKNMLIDAGETKDGAVVNYLKNAGVSKLDVIVATHPHEDHISEMASVINTFDVGQFYMPKKQHTTKSFENMVDALLAKNITVNEAKAGVSIAFDDAVKCDIIAPCNNNYSDMNNWSAVIKMTYGNNKFLFTGDAEELSEKEILDSGVDISADVLKVGHHGSHSSSTKAFIEKVAPKYAVISAAKVNDYGHPHQETLKTLSDFGVQVYGTYDYGDIVAMSDGNEISFYFGKTDVANEPTTEATTKVNSTTTKATTTTTTTKEAITETTTKVASSSKASAGNSQIGNYKSDNSNVESGTYIGNKNSKKFHSEYCSKLPAQKNRITFNSRSEAIASGYEPCKICNP